MKYRFLLRKSTITALGLLVVFGPIALLTLRDPSKTEAAWFDDSWAYRKAITITDTGQEYNRIATLSNYDASDPNKFQSDCGDVRFTDQNGKILAYTLDACNSTTNFDINMESIPNGTTTVFLYYGNATAPNGFVAADPFAACAACTVGTAGSEEKGPGPTLYYKFDDAQGTKAEDTTINNIDGTVSGASWTAETSCLAGKCLNFDGSDDVVTTANATSIDIDNNLSNFTFSAWFNADTDGENAVGQIFNKTANNYIRVDSQSGSNLKVTANLDRATTDANIIVSAATTTSTWTHVALIWDGTTLVLYVNGAQRGTATGSGAVTADTGDLLIGGANSANFDGKIDEFKIYNYARTTDQIKADFNARGTSKGTGAALGANADNQAGAATMPTLYWNLDDNLGGDGASVIDRSGSALNGTIETGVGGAATVQQTYNTATSGDTTTFTVPAGVSTITVKTWGGGGGAGGGGLATGGDGGGGGFAQADISVNAGESLIIHVADGGTGGADAAGCGAGGGGGGASAVLRTTTFLVEAGGGGAGAGGGDAGANGGDGGAGGGENDAEAGTIGAGVGPGNGGGGGRQTSGGAGGTGASGTDGTAGTENGDPTAGTEGDGGAGGNAAAAGTGGGGAGGTYGGGAGGALQSGCADNPGAGGGGGGGQWGGGGGEGNASDGGGGGGGGGSALVTGASTTMTKGTSTTPGNNSDSDKTADCSANGTGATGTGDAGASGNDGCILLLYSSADTSNKWVPGKYGSGFDFDGSDDYISVADNSLLDFADDASLTYEAWIKHATQTSGTDVILSKYNEAGYKITMEDDGDIRCGLDYDSTWTPTDSAISTAATYDDNKWHHVACVKNGASSLSLYIDGVLIVTDSSLTADNTLTNSDPFYIGIDADATSNVWTGQIDDVRIYNYARTPAQLIADLNAGNPAPGSPVGSAVAYWKMDEGYGTTAYDNNIQNGSEDLTLSTASWTNSGKFGRAFNGATNIRLSRLDDNDLNFAALEDLSISFWFKSDSITNPSANEYLVEKGGNIATDAVGYAIYTSSASDGLICFGIDDDATTFPEDEVCSASDFYDNSWHHIVATKTGTTRLDLYIDGRPNGTPDTSISATGTLANTATFFVGDTNSTDGTDEFLGDIDELKVYRSALTAGEVKLEVNRGSALVLGALSDNAFYQPNAANQEYCVPGDTTSCASPIGEWKMDEKTSTSTVIDTSTSGNDLTMNSFEITNWTRVSYGNKPNIALDFDGSAEYLSRADDADFDFTSGQSFTVEAWVRHDIVDIPLSGEADPIITKASSATFGGWKLTLTDSDPTAPLCFEIDDDGNWGPDDFACTSGVDYDTDDKWHHAVGVKNGSSNIQIYIDGILQGTDSSLAATDLSNDSALEIGRDSEITSRFWPGLIDNVKIFNYARSATQIAWDYNRGRPAGWWKFDECSGTTMYDSSGNSNNGTWTGTAAGSNTSAGNCATVLSTAAWYNGRTGKMNSSLDFDGGDDVVTVTNANAIDFDVGLISGMSFAAWIYAGSDGENDVGEVIDKGASTYMRVDTEAGGLDFEAQIDLATTDPNVNVADAFQINTWNHVAISYADDGDDDMEVYINGILRGTGLGSGAPAGTDTNNLLIGGSSAANFDGQIDDVRVFNYALTAGQVRTLMNDGAAVRFGPSTGSP